MIDDTTHLGNAPQSPEPPPPQSPAAEVLEALTWCAEQRARITWQHGDEGRLRCSVEVLAPGSTWNLLRGRADDIVSAVQALRAEVTAARARRAA